MLVDASGPVLPSGQGTHALWSIWLDWPLYVDAAHGIDLPPVHQYPGEQSTTSPVSVMAYPLSTGIGFEPGTSLTLSPERPGHRNPDSGHVSGSDDPAGAYSLTPTSTH